MTTGTGQAYEGVTDSDGRATFTGLRTDSAQKYAIRVKTPFGVWIKQVTKLAIHDGSEIVVRLNEVVGAMGVLTGTIIDQYGQPVEGAVIEFTHAVTSDNFYTPVAKYTTGANGVYTVSMPAGQYSYRVTATDAMEYRSTVPVAVVGNATSTRNVALRVGVEGGSGGLVHYWVRVASSSGLPINGAKVEVIKDGVRTGQYGITEGGVAHVIYEPLLGDTSSASDWLEVYQDDGGVETKTGESAHNLDTGEDMSGENVPETGYIEITSSVVENATLSGTVTDMQSGSGVGSVTVTATDGTGTSGPFTATTGIDGTYSLSIKTTGNWTVRFTKAGYSTRTLYLGRITGNVAGFNAQMYDTNFIKYMGGVMWHYDQLDGVVRETVMTPCAALAWVGTAFTAGRINAVQKAAVLTQIAVGTFPLVVMVKSRVGLVGIAGAVVKVTQNGVETTAFTNSIGRADLTLSTCGQYSIIVSAAGMNDSPARTGTYPYTNPGIAVSETVLMTAVGTTYSLDVYVGKNSQTEFFGASAAKVNVYEINPTLAPSTPLASGLTDAQGKVTFINLEKDKTYYFVAFGMAYAAKVASFTSTTTTAQSIVVSLLPITGGQPTYAVKVTTVRAPYNVPVAGIYVKIKQFWLTGGAVDGYTGYDVPNTPNPVCGVTPEGWSAACKQFLNMPTGTYELEIGSGTGVIKMWYTVDQAHLTQQAVLPSTGGTPPGGGYGGLPI